MDTILKENTSASAGTSAASRFRPLDASDDVTVFPNPFRDKILVHISMPSLMKNVSLLITDTRGTVIYSGTTSGREFIEINEMNNLSPGIYFLQVRTGSNAKSVKIVRAN